MSPFAYVTVIVPLAKSKLSPWLYSVLVGAVITIDVNGLYTSTINVLVIVSGISVPSESVYLVVYVAVIVCWFKFVLEYPVTVTLESVKLTLVVVPSCHVKSNFPPAKFNSVL